MRPLILLSILATVAYAQPPQSTLPPLVPATIREYTVPVRIVPRPPESYPVPIRYQQMPVRREVAPSRPFRSGYDPDHTCDRCGTQRYVVDGPGPTPGTHRHNCPRCGNSWFH